MKTCCEKNGMKHGCEQGRNCPEPMVDGGNFWYKPEPMTTSDRVLLVVIFGLCFGVLYGAARYYWGLL